jgi:hypothetical protein
MSFDLRLPIGLLFAVFGAILAVDGLVAHRLVLDINVNLWWGVVMIAFGGAMLGLAVRGSRQSSGVRPGRNRGQTGV